MRRRPIYLNEHEFVERNPVFIRFDDMMYSVGLTYDDLNLFLIDNVMSPLVYLILQKYNLTQEGLRSLANDVLEEQERNRIEDEEEQERVRREEEEANKENIKPPSDNIGGRGLLARDVGTLPPSTRSLLEKDKDKPIKRLTIFRKPIDVNSLLKILKSAKLVDYAYDDLFHLGVNIGYDMTSEDVNLEKTEYIKLYKGKLPSKATETLDVPIPQNYVSGRQVLGQKAVNPKFTTIGELFEKLRSQMGDKFTEYDVVSNNCQTFITNILKVLNLDTPENLKFVNQDVESVVKSLGGKFAEAIAGLAVSVKQAQNRLQEGEGCGCGEDDKLELYNFNLPRCRIQS